jgi:hypothetical protein
MSRAGSEGFRGRSDAYVANNVIVKEQKSVLQFHETFQQHVLQLLEEVNQIMIIKIA